MSRGLRSSTTTAQVLPVQMTGGLRMAHEKGMLNVPKTELVGSGERRARAAFAIGAIVDVPGTPEPLVDLDTPDDVRQWLERKRGT